MEAPSVSPEIRAAEREIDSHHLMNPLMRQSFAVGAWNFLAACEEIQVREVVQQTETTNQEFAAIADNLVVYTKWPMRWLFKNCRAGGELPRQYSDTLYKDAWDLLQLSSKYVSFESAFLYASSGYLPLEAHGNRISASGPMRNDAGFDAYDRLTRPQKVPETSNASAYLHSIEQSVRVIGDSFAYDLNPKIVRDGLEALGPFLDDRFSLPEDWKFPRYTVGQFAQVARVLYVLSLIHFHARMTAAGRGCYGLGISRALMVMEKNELVRRVRRYSGISEAAVIGIIEDLTYGGRNQINPDPALQPIVALSPSKLAIPPNLLMYSSMERNLAVLQNRIPDGRDVYSMLSNQKEDISRSSIIANLSNMGFRFWHGHIPQWNLASEIDLAIISDTAKRCLILELKSLIAPADPREILDRADDIRKGVAQIRDRIEKSEILREPMMSALHIDEEYQICWAVASETTIGPGFVQSDDVPIIKIDHLLARLEQNLGLVDCCLWLEHRHYLPVEGIHYREVEIEVEIAGWTLEWYAITDLVDSFV